MRLTSLMAGVLIAAAVAFSPARVDARPRYRLQGHHQTSFRSQHRTPRARVHPSFRSQVRFRAPRHHHRTIYRPGIRLGVGIGLGVRYGYIYDDYHYGYDYRYAYGPGYARVPGRGYVTHSPFRGPSCRGVRVWHHHGRCQHRRSCCP